MLVSQAIAAATAWTREYAKTHAIVGAVLNGSTLDRADGDLLPESSDVDINLIVEGEPPDKPGKFRHQGALLEASFLPLSMVEPMEKALTTYEIAGAFRSVRGLLFDPSGRIGPIVTHVSERFAQPEWVRIRCENVYRKIVRGMGSYREDLPVLDNVNCWLFPTGILTHAILVAALRNPTVRLRYLRARAVLEEWDRPDVYEALLEPLGCRDMTASQVLRHLQGLERTFDLAAACRKTAFPFQNDIDPSARAVAIGGSRELIETGNPREAIFWMAATYERCHRILRADAPELHETLLPDFTAFLADLGVRTHADLRQRFAQVEGLLPFVRKVVDGHLAQ
ncbi:MAG TPA: hypothetical protein PKE04_16385 [Clostridia bacterium]|nr:hypothetical protein [Clostridia bacterium]